MSDFTAREQTILQAFLNADEPLSINDVEDIVETKAQYYGLGKVILCRLRKKLAGEGVAMSEAWSNKPSRPRWKEPRPHETNYRRKFWWLTDDNKQAVRALLGMPQAQSTKEADHGLVRSV